MWCPRRGTVFATICSDARRSAGQKRRRESEPLNRLAPPELPTHREGVQRPTVGEAFWRSGTLACLRSAGGRWLEALADRAINTENEVSGPVLVFPSRNRCPQRHTRQETSFIIKHAARVLPMSSDNVLPMSPGYTRAPPNKRLMLTGLGSRRRNGCL